jgi:hypothetical protein
MISTGSQIWNAETISENARKHREHEAEFCKIRAICPGCGEDVPAHYIRADINACEYCEQAHDYGLACDCPNCNPTAFEGTAHEETPMIGENSQAAADFAMHPDGCPCDACEQDDAPEMMKTCTVCGLTSDRGSWVEYPVPGVCYCFECAKVYPRIERDGTRIWAPEKSFAECCEDPTFLRAVNHALRSQGARTILAGAALLATLVLPGHASADTLAQVPAGCAIAHTFEDGSATATCANGTRIAFDADGGFVQDHGIVFYYRAPGTWYQVR